ncbi:MAG: glycosyltransferase family 4 protein [candidate division WOR-3 bacterium]|nr:MAG: glycosyltransferase family 4 protein [candidate division WOR-3 bacterium]
MKIFIVINTLAYGGAEMQAVMDANALADIGHSVTVAYNENGNLVSLLSDKVLRYRIRYRNVILASLQLFIHLFECRYDIVHSHMFWAEKVSALPCFFTGQKVIFNEHGLGLWRRWYHIMVVRFISSLAASLVTSCNAVKEVKIKREKIDSRKVCTVYNSVNDRHPPRSNDEGMRRLSVRNSLVIGFVGRFNEVKRLHLLIDVAEKLVHKVRGLMFVLVGDGAEKSRMELEIKRTGLAEYFDLPGSTLNTVQYYRAFDIFALPSRIEGFSLALLEACACGTAAIAFDVGGNSEIIQDGRTGYLVREGNIEEFTRRIRQLCKNRMVLAKMGRRAESFVRDNFSISRRVNGLLRVYRGGSQ